MEVDVMYKIISYFMNEKLKKRLFSMGFLIGEKIVLRKKSILKHNYLLEVGGILYVVGEQLASKICVEIL